MVDSCCKLQHAGRSGSTQSCLAMMHQIARRGRGVATEASQHGVHAVTPTGMARIFVAERFVPGEFVLKITGRFVMMSDRSAKRRGRSFGRRFLPSLVRLNPHCRVVAGLLGFGPLFRPRLKFRSVIGWNSLGLLRSPDQTTWFDLRDHFNSSWPTMAADSTNLTPLSPGGVPAGRRDRGRTSGSLRPWGG